MSTYYFMGVLFALVLLLFLRAVCGLYFAILEMF